jgi:hypothetical protein
MSTGSFKPTRNVLPRIKVGMAISTHHRTIFFKAPFAMRLPSSSSLLLASLAVSASSSSSLSALAAPAGDIPEDSSPSNSVVPCRDGAVTRSLGAPIGIASALFPDIATDHPQSRGLLEPLLKDVKGTVDDLLKLLAARDFESAADKDSTSPDSTTPPPGPPAPPSTPAMPDLSDPPVRLSTSPNPPAKD